METALPLASQVIPHGTKCRCDACDSPGRWDDMQHKKGMGEYFVAEFDDAIWLNTDEHRIECYECWLK